MERLSTPAAIVLAFFTPYFIHVMPRPKVGNGWIPLKKSTSGCLVRCSRSIGVRVEEARVTSRGHTEHSKAERIAVIKDVLHRVQPILRPLIPPLNAPFVVRNWYPYCNHSRRDDVEECQCSR